MRPIFERVVNVVQGLTPGLEKLRKLLTELPGFLPRLATYGVGLLFVIVVYRSVTDRTIIVEPFELPASLQSQGYSGRVVASRLINALMEYRREVIARPGVLSEFKSDFRAVETEIEVEAAGFSSRKVSQAIAYAFGSSPPRVSGEFTVVGERVYATLRVGGEAHALSGTVDKFDSLIREMAPGIVKASEPYFFALDVADCDPRAALAIVLDVVRTGDPTWKPWAYNLWGMILDKRGMREEAREKFRAVLNFREPLIGGASIRSAHAAAYNNLGVSYAKDGRKDYQAALQHFRTAIRLKPDYGSAHANLAEVLRADGQQDVALLQYSRAIELNPGQADLYYKRGLVYCAKEDPDPKRAAADFRFSLALDSKRVKILYRLGMAPAAQDLCDDAIKVLERSLDAQAAEDRDVQQAEEQKMQCASKMKRMVER